MHRQCDSVVILLITIVALIAYFSDVFEFVDFFLIFCSSYIISQLCPGPTRAHIPHSNWKVRSVLYIYMYQYIFTSLCISVDIHRP